MKRIRTQYSLDFQVVNNNNEPHIKMDTAAKLGEYLFTEGLLEVAREDVGHQVNFNAEIYVTSLKEADEIRKLLDILSMSNDPRSVKVSKELRRILSGEEKDSVEDWLFSPPQGLIG